MTAKYEKIQSVENEVHPKSTATIFSRLMFWWMNDILSTGYNRDLDLDDLYPLMDKHKTQRQVESLERNWNEQVHHSKGKRKLFRALLHMFSWEDYTSILGMSFVFSIFMLLRPVFISLVMHLMMYGKAQDYWRVYFYGAGIGFSSLIANLGATHVYQTTRVMSMRWRVAITGLILKKVFQLKQTEVAKITSGHIIELVSCDAMRFEYAIGALDAFCRSVILVFVLVVMAALLVGFRTLSGFLLMIFMIAYLIVSGFRCAKLRKKVAESAGERLSLMRAIICGIRTVKMYAWEWPLIGAIGKLRRREMYLIRLKSVISAAMKQSPLTCRSAAVAISLGTLAATGTQLNFYNTFVTVVLLSVMQVMAFDIGIPTKYLADFSIALSRIQQLLEPKEWKDNSFREELTLENNQRDSSKSYKEHLEHSNDAVQEQTNRNSAEVVFEKVWCHWNNTYSESPALWDVSFTATTSKLVVVTGRAGSGKSSLLLAVLGELLISKGEIFCSGKIAHISQQAWVFSGTLRENILFGLEMDLKRYNMTIEACQLVPDIAAFPDGDLTTTGDRGVLLSGGQKSRVALARAVYMNADIYLMDDPLSAVDAKVGRQIFEKCICGILSEKTRILVTHRLQFIKRADLLVVMKDGTIVQEGTYPELLEAGFLDVIDISTEEELKVAEQTRENCPGNMAQGDSGLEIKGEDKMTGSVTMSLYWEYLRAGLSGPTILMFIVLFCFVQAIFITSDWWLLKTTSDNPSDQDANLRIYGAFIGGVVVLSLLRAFLSYYAVIKSSQTLHERMLGSVIRAPVLFYDTNLVERILNRFSKDVGIMDDRLPDSFLDAMQSVLYVIGSVLLPIALNPWIALGAVPLFATVALVARFYLKSSQDLTRLEAVSKSPVLSHFTDTIEGLTTIKAQKMELLTFNQFCSHQDAHNRIWFLLLSSTSWLNMQTDAILCFFILVVFYASVATHASPGLTALSVIYSLQAASASTRYAVRMCAELENFMKAVERVITYTKLEQEPGYQSEKQPPENWPWSGKLEVKNLSQLYYPGGPTLLKDVSFAVKAHEKIGVVGRTGGDKSSLVSALFRMSEFTGQIVIDGVDIGSLNIQTCRKAISVIAQDPVLFTGTLRMNLDPFEEYSDEDIWESLDKAHLTTRVKNLPKQLLYEVKECGLNFSVGERQLLCLALILLKRSKIILLEETTASVNCKTDRLIQETLRTSFQDYTVITVAHRLDTIMDYDRILVLQDGEIVEFDEPQVLLSKKDGCFAELYRNYCTRQQAI